MKPPRIRRPRLTYANVASTFALLIATSMGGAYAHGMISSSEIQQNAVKSRHIAAGHVKTADLAASAVKNAKIADNAVNSAKVAPGSLNGSDLAPRTLGLIQAAANVSGAGVMRYQFNRLGGPVTVAKIGTGLYELTVPGAIGSFTNRLVGVSSVNFIGRCIPWDGVGTKIRVKCVNTSTLADFDADFQVWLMGASGDGAARTAPRTTGGPR